MTGFAFFAFLVSAFDVCFSCIYMFLASGICFCIYTLLVSGVPCIVLHVFVHVLFQVYDSCFACFCLFLVLDVRCMLVFA